VGDLLGEKEGDLLGAADGVLDGPTVVMVGEEEGGVLGEIVGVLVAADGDIDAGQQGSASEVCWPHGLGCGYRNGRP